jgi:hypothetical protein
MLAASVQLPAAVLTNDRCGVTGRAPSRSEFEPEPEPSAGAASASRAQVAGARYLMLTTKATFSRLDERGKDRKEALLLPQPGAYKTLKSSLFGIVERDPESFLSVDPDWRPTLRQEQFGIADLLTLAEGS